MDVKIRTAKSKDFSDVFNLFKQLWPSKPLNEKDLKKVFENGIKSNVDHFICGELNGKVIAFCSFTIMNNFWQEGKIAFAYAMIVEEKFRNNGIGKAIMLEAINQSKNLDCKRFELDSAFHREEAHKFYENLGFEKRAFLFSYNLLDN